MADQYHEEDEDGTASNPIELNKQLDDFLKDSCDVAQLEKHLKEARAHYTGDEWALTDAQSRDGETLSLKKNKAVIERIVGSVLENSFDLSVTARDLPQTPLEHPFQQVLQQQAPLLALKGDEEAKILAEMLTVAAENIREELHLDEVIARCIEQSLVDSCVILKDGKTLYADHFPLSVEVVNREHVRVNAGVRDFKEAEHVAHIIEMPKDRFLATFPECTQDDLDEASAEGPKGDEAKKNLVTYEEHWIYSYEMEEVEGDEDEEPYDVMVYPGGWRKVARVGKKILFDGPNPHDHKRLPLHCLVGVSDPQRWHGLSLSHDVLYNMSVGLNKMASMALRNVERTANNKNLVNPDHLENPEALNDSTVNVVLKEGSSFDQAVRQLVGSDISNGFNVVSQALSAHYADISGVSDLPPPGSPPTASDVVKSGFRTGLLRRRVKTVLEDLLYNLLLNLVHTVDELQSFRLQGGMGDIAYATFNPHIFAELQDRFHVRFEINVADQETLPSNPFDRAKMVNEMVSTARAVSETTGLKLSQSLAMIPSMPGKNIMVRQVRADEYRREQEAAEAKARGEVAPELAEEEKKMERERADAISEVVKKAMQKWADEDPVAMASLAASGGMEMVFKIAQGQASPQEAQAIMPLLPGPLQQAVQAMLTLAQQEQMRLQQEQMMQQAQAQPPQAPPTE